MNLTKKQEEKLVMGIQAGVGILIIALAVRNSAQIHGKAMKTVLNKEAKRTGKLKALEYRQQKKLLKRKYKKKLDRAKKGLRQQGVYGRIN